MNIISDRIIIRPLSIEELINIVNMNRNKIDASNASEFDVSCNQIKAINIKIEKMNKIKKEFHNWYTYWIITNKETTKPIGLIGFKGFDLNCEVEIGYKISKKFEGKGFATESVGAMIKWAFKSDLCEKIVAKKVLKHNYGSRRVLIKNGFTKYEEKLGKYSYILKKKS